jgi:hypothetical protein
MRGISWLAENMLASQEGLCSRELVNDYSCWDNETITSSWSHTMILDNWTSKTHFSDYNTRNGKSPQMNKTVGRMRIHKSVFYSYYTSFRSVLAGIRETKKSLYNLSIIIHPYIYCWSTIPAWYTYYTIPAASIPRSQHLRLQFVYTQVLSYFVLWTDKITPPATTFISFVNTCYRFRSLLTILKY